jgi:hypothetical protein
MLLGANELGTSGPTHLLQVIGADWPHQQAAPAPALAVASSMMHCSVIINSRSGMPLKVIPASLAAAC